MFRAFMFNLLLTTILLDFIHMKTMLYNLLKVSKTVFNVSGNKQNFIVNYYRHSNIAVL